jgi:transposase
VSEVAKVTLTVADGIATIELTNPGKRNAMDVEMADQLVAACDAIDADPAVGGGVLHGGRVFCSGGDRADLDAATKAPFDDTNFNRIKLDKEIPAELDVHLICDNYATHKAPAVATWLDAHPRFHMHFTPTYASWLNQVERWFALLTDKKLRRGAHRSIQALEKDIRDWISTWNDNPKPFTWTKTADEILERLASYLQRIPGAGHSVIHD